ncbi:penicillin-binding protein activator [Trichlorobacter lovleyi]|uniref:penicillin-binding protein activator n=1 Tax=Trichlorobacter lovleyi TaxID=313985 RepID=UPI002240810A|nr:penicillin-binding protein activator [Trichlorobacter lovleyi]QOX77955.1 penicillin-binding protein activator [Trichlorobacter lovleyi]
MKIRPFFLLQMLLLCTLLVQGGCSSSSSSSDAPQTVSIGVLAPLTGSLKHIGEGMQVALEIGLPQVNRRLALEGQNFRLTTVVKDTASDPQGALMALLALKAQGVRFVIGPVSSAECATILPVANSLGMILISPASTATSLAIAGDNLFRLMPNDNSQGAGTAALMLKKGFSAVVPIWRGDVWGDDLKASITTAFQNGGGTVLSGVRYTPDAGAYGTELDQAAAQVSQALSTYGAGKVAVAMISYPTESVPLLSGAAGRPALAQAGWFGSDASTLSPLITASAAASAFAAQTNLLSPIFSREDAVLPLKGTVLIDRALREKLSQRLGRQADSTTFATWDALWLAAKTYTAGGISADSETLKTGLVSVAKSNVGLNGALVMNAAGDMNKGNYGFYSIAASGSSYAWQLKAAYQYELLATPQVVDVSEPVLKGLTPPAAEVKIGALLSLTGSQSYNGQSVRAGLLVALDNINTYLTRHGYPVKIALEIIDTASDADQALNGFTTLADQGIRFIVGPITSSECQRVLPAANSRGVILLSPSSNAIQLAQPDDNLIRFVPSAVLEAQGLAKLMYEQGVRSLAIMARNDIWGSDLASRTGSEFQALGGSVITSVTYPTDTTNFASQLTTLAGALNTATPSSSAVLTASFDEITEIFLQAPTYPSLATVKWYGSDGSAQNERLAATPAAAAYAAARSFTCPIEHVFIQHAPQPNSITKLVIRDDIREAYSGIPALYAYPAWDALWIIVTSLLDSEWSTSPAVLRSAVLSGSDNYIGMSNFMGLDANGDRKYGDYAFFSMTQGTAAYTWNLFATYHYHPALYLTPKITYP